MTSRYSYDSTKAQRILERIMGSLLKHSDSGATQATMAAESGTSRSSISHYLAHLIENEKAYEAGKITTPSGGTAVVYKPGRDPGLLGHSRHRADPYHLPTSFFGVAKK